MRRTRAVTLTALVAASAMVFAACSSSPGQAAPSSTASTPASAGIVGQCAPAGRAVPPPVVRRAPRAAARPAPPRPDPAHRTPATTAAAHRTAPTRSPGAAAGSITSGLDELATSWNNVTSHGNSVYNANPTYLTQAQSYYYDSKLNAREQRLVHQVHRVTSKSPLTVKYVINTAAKWSDGVPITADDLLLQWIAKSGKYSTGKLKTDADGNTTGATGVAFDIATPVPALITQIPDDLGRPVHADRRVQQAVRRLPASTRSVTALIPAHVVGEKALGITDPTKAVEAI